MTTGSESKAQDRPDDRVHDAEHQRRDDQATCAVRVHAADRPG